jgi:hypothetical protein
MLWADPTGAMGDALAQRVFVNGSLQTSTLAARLSTLPVSHVLGAFSAFPPSVSFLLDLRTPLSVHLRQDDALLDTLFASHQTGPAQYSAAYEINSIDYNALEFDFTVLYNSSMLRGESVPYLINRMTVPHPSPQECHQPRKWHRYLDPPRRIQVLSDAARAWAAHRSRQSRWHVLLCHRPDAAAARLHVQPRL